MKIELQGHTDAQGDDDHNLELSKNRAKAVYDYLVKQGVDAKQMTHKGYGETKPSSFFKGFHTLFHGQAGNICSAFDANTNSLIPGNRYFTIPNVSNGRIIFYFQNGLYEPGYCTVGIFNGSTTRSIIRLEVAVFNVSMF